MLPPRTMTAPRRQVGVSRVAGPKRRWKPNYAGLRPHQCVGVDTLLRHRHFGLFDDMRCVDGDAIVRVNRAARGFAITLKELHRKFHGGISSTASRWDPTIPTHIRSLCDGDLRLNPIEDVLDKGVRPVLKVTLASGKTLRLTADHRVCVSLDGSKYVRANKLQAGSHVVTNGQPVCKLCRTTENVVTNPYAKFPGHCRRCVYRKLRAKPTWIGGKSLDEDGYVRVSGQWDHPRRHSTGFVVEHVLVVEKAIGRYLVGDEQVHHKNGIKHDNRLENLELTTHAEHARLHGREGGFRRMSGGRSGKGGLVEFVPKLDRVVSVRKDGTAHVYDVVCKAPHHNFVANGIVVHNCGKTATALRALPPRARVIVVAPRSVIMVWIAEIARWRPDLRAVPTKVMRRPDEGEVLLFSWDGLPEPTPGSCFLVRGSMVDVYLIGDEIHKACNGGAQRSQRWRMLANQCSYVWGLSGTPMPGKPDQLWGVLLSIKCANAFDIGMVGPDGDVLGAHDTFWKLCNATPNIIRDKVTKQLRNVGWKWGEVSPEVRRIVETVSLRRLAKDILDLPPKQYQDVPCETPEDLRDYLDEEAREAWAEVDQDELPPFQLLSGAMKALADSKVEAAIEFAKDAAESAPLLVFSAHVNPILAFADVKGAGYVTGTQAGIGTKVMKREDVIRSWKEGKQRILAMTIETGGMGLNLSEAGGILFVDKAYNPGDNDQAERRADEDGRTAPVMVWSMVSTHPLDRNLNRILAEKSTLREAIGV